MKTTTYEYFLKRVAHHSDEHVDENDESADDVHCIQYQAEHLRRAQVRVVILDFLGLISQQRLVNSIGFTAAHPERGPK